MKYIYSNISDRFQRFNLPNKIQRRYNLNMPEQFATEFAVNPAVQYDASKLKGKSVVVTGGPS